MEDYEIIREYIDSGNIDLSLLGKINIISYKEILKLLYSKLGLKYNNDIALTYLDIEWDWFYIRIKVSNTYYGIEVDMLDDYALFINNKMFRKENKTIDWMNIDNKIIIEFVNKIFEDVKLFFRILKKYKKLFQVEYLLNYKLAITFLLCHPPFPRDIRRIITNKILFFYFFRSFILYLTQNGPTRVYYFLL